MSTLSAGLAPLLHLQLAPSTLAIGFAVALVLSLVAAEESEVRRAARAEG